MFQYPFDGLTRAPKAGRDRSLGPGLLPEVINNLTISHERLTPLAGDFFADPLPPADVYLLIEVLHDWTDEKCQAILGAIRRAAPPGAKLLVIENVLSDDKPDPRGHILDVIMMANTGGRERTQPQTGRPVQQLRIPWRHRNRDRRPDAHHRNQHNLTARPARARYTVTTSAQRPTADLCLIRRAAPAHLGSVAAPVQSRIVRRHTSPGGTVVKQNDKQAQAAAASGRAMIRTCGSLGRVT